MIYSFLAVIICLLLAILGANCYIAISLKLLYGKAPEEITDKKTEAAQVRKPQYDNKTEWLENVLNYDGTPPQEKHINRESVNE